MIVLLITLVLMFQQDSLLQYGDQVTGTITADVTAIDYQFDGQANDILFVTLYADNRTLHNPLLTPILILRDSSGEILVDTTTQYTVDDSLLITVLPKDDRYTITASRDENVALESTGDFILTLDTLTPQTDISDTILSGNITTNYHAVASDEQFSIIYQHLEGDYHPQVTVHTLNPENGGLTMQAGVFGAGMQTANLGTFLAGELYIITVDQYIYDYYPQPIEAMYQLHVIMAE